MSAYLGSPHAQILRFVKKHRYLKRQSLGAAKRPITYVNPHAAMRVIAHFRRIQGEVYADGKDFHALLERRRVQWRELNARARLALANPGAEAEAERQRSACAKAESPKPRRCV